MSCLLMKFQLPLFMLPCVVLTSAQHKLAMDSVLTPVDFVDSLHMRYYKSNNEAVGLVNKLEAMVFLTSAQNAINITDLCVKALMQLGADLIDQKYHAFEIDDSWGKPESGLLRLNLTWFGRYYECTAASSDNISGKYCMAHFGKTAAPAGKIQHGFYGLTIGTCVPDAYSAESNITAILATLVQNTINATVSWPEKFVEWKIQDIFAIIVLMLLIILVLASSLYEYINMQLEAKRNDTEQSQLLSDRTPQIQHECMSTGKRVLLSFSAIGNTAKLLSTKQKPTEIHCLHGMRFMSMSWVLLFHAFLLPSNYTDNLHFLARYFVDHWDFQVVFNGTFSVDTFFYMSGLLVVFLGLVELSKSDGSMMNVLLKYLYRYLRLTPAYAFCILMSVTLWPKFGEGPLWPEVVRPLSENCRKYWWSNLLYINNFYPSTEAKQCFLWGWYLANDMQFYLIHPLLIFLLYRYPIVGISLTSFVTFVSILITGVFSSITKQQPAVIDLGVRANSLISPPQPGVLRAAKGATPQYGPYIADLYGKPWCRIGAYLVGVLTGYILYKTKDQLRMNKFFAVAGWLVAAGINCTIVYGLYPAARQGKFLDVNTAGFYNAVSRPMWCVGLAWVTVACVSGCGGPVNKFLSWKGFMPLSRLTYCSYLIHPLVIWWFIGTQDVLFHYSIPMVMMLLLGSLVVTNLCAFAVHLLIEAPIIGLVKIVTGKKETTHLAESMTLDRLNCDEVSDA